MRLPRAILLAGCVCACSGDGTGGLRPDEPGKLVLGPATIEVHARQSFVIKASLPTGAPVDGVTWTTTDARVARVFGDSLIPFAEGTATITATLGGRTGTMKVTVVPDVSLGYFQSPFVGDYPTANVFDHDLPYEFKPQFDNGYLLSYWGEKFGPGVDSHNGYDWVLPFGTPVYSAAPGRVIFAGTETPFACPIFPNSPAVAGQGVTIAHGVYPNEYITTSYWHFSSIDVKAGDQIPAHRFLGYSGNSGCSSGPHLHFAVRRMRGCESFPRAGSQTLSARMDPYGWVGTGPDPWVADTGGVESVALWTQSRAPRLYGGGHLPTFNTPVVTYYAQYWGLDDTRNPNNEFVDLSTPGAGMNLGGWSLRNAAGETYVFPPDAEIPKGVTGWIRVYSGKGTNAKQTLYWGRDSGAWNNFGDCLQLLDNTGKRVSSVSLIRDKCGELGITAPVVRTPRLDWSPAAAPDQQ